MVISDLGSIEKVIPGYRYGFSDWNEYYVATDAVFGTSTAASGGTNDINSASAVVAGHPGVCRMSSGTSATGSASLRAVNAGHILGNTWYFRYDCIFKFAKLSDGTDTYTLRMGFIDSGTGESTDGVFLRYTDSVNSGKWVLVARSNSTETTTNATNAALTTTNYYHMTIEVNSAGTSAEFFQDGVSIGTVASNIPTGASRNCGVGIMFLKSAGTSDTALLDIDGQGIIAYSTALR